MTEAAPPLPRRLGLRDAVAVGLGSMVGAGLFVVFAPAAARAQGWLLVGLVLAAAVAYANATSSAQLAAQHPEAGGTYAYARHRLGPAWGALAGYAFVLGKVASCAAAALVVGSYLAPDSAPHLRAPVALGVLVAATAVNLAGVSKTAGVTALLVAVVLAGVLAALAVANLAPTAAPAATATGAAAGARAGLGPVTPVDVVGAAALLFYAFAGYARIATLGAEVRDPARTIPRAIPLALGIALAVYAGTALTLLRVLGTDRLAASPRPLADAAAAGTTAWIGPDGAGPARVAVGALAAIAATSVLVSLLAGVSRTTYAMAARGDLPRALATVSRRTRVPRRAELLVAVGTAAVVIVGAPEGAVAVSAATVLLYYAVTNAAALRLARHERRWPRGLAVAGLAGCLALAVTLPAPAVLRGGAALVALLALRWAARRALRSA